ncbi:MAG: hypothetical protein ACK4TA_19250 [Saprospiraceae bacterium]
MKKLLVFTVSLLILQGIQAQEHDHHQMQMDTTKKAPATPMEHDMQHEHNMQMTHAYSLSLPMNRNASGTAWLPDNSPMYGYMLHSRTGWNFMFHGNLFLQYNWQNLNNNYQRGGKEFQAPNWVMGMAMKQVGQNGLFTFTGMFSLDPVVMQGNGYRLLFQSGESWKDQPLIDRQHPHDLISALSIAYTQRFSEDVDVTAYFGYPGEPALGAPAFMHRISSISNPNAPLGHHWQDATHITFGVGTLGIRYQQLKVEGSIFTGREPNEARFDFDKPRFDSYSYRVSFNPSAALALQFSQGFIKSPEAIAPEEDVTRTTASAILSQNWNGLKYNGIIAWGLNNAGHGHREHSITWENNVDFNDKDVLYGRYEWIQKSAEELGLEEELGHDAIEPIHSLTIGYSRRLATIASTNLFLGGQATWNTTTKALEKFYGNNPLSAQVYVRITPQLMR